MAISLFLYDVPGLTPVIPIRSEATIAINTSSSGNTLLVTHTGSNVIRFSYHVFSTGITSVSFVYGTGSACAAGTTTIDGPYDLVAATGMTSIDMVIPSGNDLCVNNSNAIHLGGAVSYISRLL